MDKTKKKTKRNRKTKKSHKNVFNKEVISIIMILLGILILLSLLSQRMGIVGSFIRGTSFKLMGFGSYFFPIIIIFVGIIYILEKYNNNELKKSIILGVIFLSFLILLDGKNMYETDFVERMKLANIQSLSNKGGGAIGTFIGFFFYKLFGLGGYLILFLITGIGVMIFMDISVSDITNYGKELVARMKIERNLVKNDKGIKRNKNKENNEFYNRDDNESSKAENLKILEYNDRNNKEANQKNEKTRNNQVKSIESETDKIEYISPPLSLLNNKVSSKDPLNKKDIVNNAKKIEETISNFGIDGSITKINIGPTITCYELKPSPGIKLNRIVSLSDNIALSLAATDIRIEAPIPGKSAVGIEVPNRHRDKVVLKEVLLSSEFKNINSNVPLVLGKDVTGSSIVSSIDKMPHLLIAGATGSGKSVCINTIIISIIYKSPPEEVKLLLIDPKVVELSVYKDIPHLLIPVVTDPKKAASALSWAVEEMEKRYKLFAKSGVRDINSYNIKNQEDKEKKLSTIVIIIDELADLMMVSAKEVEDYISRLAQMARAAGIFLIIATQRPSVDVITGTIKANIPSRISFAVSSQVDSRTILDTGGAEKLLGNGDMLFYPSTESKPLRIQGAFISDEEITRIIEYLNENYSKDYDKDAIDVLDNDKQINLDHKDELLDEAIKLVVAEEQASISMLQRRLRIGYARAARIVDEMELKGIVGGHKGSKPRKVLVTKEDIESLNDISIK